MYTQSQMNEIIEIDPNLIDAKINNRDFNTAENMRHVESVATSIKEIGQGQPITVKTLPNGRYQLVAGETRTRACRLLSERLGRAWLVKAMVQDGRSLEDEHIHMLAENDGRKDTNDIEKANGYRHHLDQFGLTVEQLAKKLGKRVDFIQKRLDLLTLRPDIQKLVQDGGLGVNYANCMIGLDINRQRIAIDTYNEQGAIKSVKWYAAVCGELMAQQAQDSLFSWGCGDDTAVPPPVKVAMPLDPAQYRPSFDLSNPSTVKAELEKWQAAADGWRSFGKQNKVEHCQGIIATMVHLLAVLPAGVGLAGVSRVDSGENETAVKIRGLLLRAGGEATKGWLTRYANETGVVVERTLEEMERDGKVQRRTAGRGERWVWAGA